MANVIEGDRGGMIKKIIHGEEEKEEEKKNLSPESRKNQILLFLGFLLVILSLSTLAYFTIFQKKITTVPVAAQFVPLIFNDQNAFLEVKDLDKNEIIKAVVGEINSSEVKDGGVDGIYLTESNNIIGLRRFLNITDSSFVPGNPAFVYDNFLLGMFNNTDKDTGTAEKDFFILLKVRSLPDVFDAMRAWEGKMFDDLHGFFGVDINADTKDLSGTSFEDGIIGNKNARILYDKNRKIIMMYVYADDNSVIITDSSQAVTDIMLRLASGQVKQ